MFICRKFNSKAWIVSCLVCFISLIITSPVLAITEEAQINYSLRNTVNYYYHKAPDLDWKYALGLAGAGDSGALDFQVGSPDLSQVTDIANRLIGLAAAQQDPTAVTVSGEVYNLVQLLVTAQQTDGYFGPEGSSLNNTIWGMIALDLAATNGIPEADYNVEAAVKYIISKQKDNGGFDESGWGDDADSTAHALIALAPHLAANHPVISQALNYLNDKQLDTGGIDNWGDNPASTATVIEALIAIGEDPQGLAWTKNGHTLVDSLLTSQGPDGGFVQDSAWGPIDNTPYALLALADLAVGQSKYQRQLEVPRDMRVAVTAPARFAPGGDADIKLTITNTAIEIKPALAIAVLYDNNDRMIKYAYLQRDVAAGDTETAGLGFSLPTGADYQIKVMVWDTWENRMPLASAITIPVY